MPTKLRAVWPVRSADDADDDRLGPEDPGPFLGPDVQDGVVAVVAVGGHVGGQSVLTPPMPIVPVSARSNLASSRSSVVLPLPDGPRVAVRNPWDHFSII